MPTTIARSETVRFRDEGLKVADVRRLLVQVVDYLSTRRQDEIVEHVETTIINANPLTYLSVRFADEGQRRVELPVGHDVRHCSTDELRRAQLHLMQGRIGDDDRSLLDACVSYIILNAPFAEK